MSNFKFVYCVRICLFVLIMFGPLVSGCKKSPDGQQGNDGTGDVEKPKNEGSGSEVSSKEGWVPLEIELPESMYEGTEIDKRLPNTEKLLKTREPFYAPAGTVNVAAGKPVSSSDPEPFGDLTMLTDGDKEAADGSFVELTLGLQYVTIDLEAEYNIYAILFWHFHKEALTFKDVIVEISNDPNFIDSEILFNNDMDNSAGKGIGTDMHYVESHLGKLVDAKGKKARYVRLYSNGNIKSDFNDYIEVEVYGKPAQ